MDDEYQKDWGDIPLSAPKAKAMNEIMNVAPGKMYQHRNGGRYVVARLVAMKVNDQWVPGVLYFNRSSEEDRYYCRTLEQFTDGRFVELSQDG